MLLIFRDIYDILVDDFVHLWLTDDVSPIENVVETLRDYFKDISACLVPYYVEKVAISCAHKVVSRYLLFLKGFSGIDRLINEANRKESSANKIITGPFGLAKFGRRSSALNASNESVVSNSFTTAQVERCLGDIKLVISFFVELEENLADNELPRKQSEEFPKILYSGDKTSTGDCFIFYLPGSGCCIDFHKELKYIISHIEVSNSFAKP